MTGAARRPLTAPPELRGHSSWPATFSACGRAIIKQTYIYLHWRDKHIFQACVSVFLG
jgi:hypothetical protein